MTGRNLRITDLAVTSAAFVVLLAGLPAGPGGAPGNGATLLATGLSLYLLGWAPGAGLITLMLRPAAPGELMWRLAAPVALSPIVSGTAVTLAALLGVPFERAAFVPGAVALLFMLLGLLPRRSDPAACDPQAAPPRERVQALGLAAASALLIAVVYLVNPWVRWRADTRFHIGVVAEVLRGGLPPTDPFFAGLSLQYMWFFHAYVAALKSLSGAPTPALLAVINIVALAGVVLLLWHGIRGVGKPHAAALLGTVLVIFAMGGHGWIFLPIKLAGVFTGADRGWKALEGIFALWPPKIARSMGFFGIWMDQSFFLRKFLVGTAMSLNLAVLLLYFDLCRRSLAGAGFGNAVLAAVAAAGVIVLHPMMGIPAVAAMTATVLAVAVWPRFRSFAEGDPGWNRALGVVAVNVAGAVLAVPYLRLVTSGKEGPAGFPADFYIPKEVSLVAGTLGVGLFAVPWMWRVLVKDRSPRLWEFFAAAWALFLAGAGALVRFPLERENIDKPTLLWHLALAPIAGWVLYDLYRGGGRSRRRWIVILIAAITVPINAVILPAYMLEKDPRVYRPHEKEALALIDRTAPADAIVFDSQDRDIPGVEIPRRQYWGLEQYASTHEYPKAEMDRRRGLRDALYAPGGPDAAGMAGLKSIGAPTYVLVRAGAAEPGAGHTGGRGRVDGRFSRGEMDPLAGNAAFDRVFDSDDVRVYRLR